MLRVGSQVVATKTIGPVRRGTPGVITDVTRAPFLFFWSRAVYLCSFAGNISLAVRPGEVDVRRSAATHWPTYRTS